MPPRKIKPGAEHGYIGAKTYKPPVKKVYLERESITQYRLQRDRIIFADVFTCQQSKDEILEFRKK